MGLKKGWFAWVGLIAMNLLVGVSVPVDASVVDDATTCVGLGIKCPGWLIGEFCSDHPDICGLCGTLTISLVDCRVVCNIINSWEECKD